MKHLIPKRRWAALLMMGVTLASVASAAFAGGDFYGHRRWHSSSSCEAPRVSASFSWRSGERGYGDRWYDGRGDYGYVERRYDDRGYYGGRFSRDGACAVDHPPHSWYDGRLWCSGKNADGSWRGPWHCEDEWGRKKVNLESFDPGCEKWVR